MSVLLNLHIQFTNYGFRWNLVLVCMSSFGNFSLFMRMDCETYFGLRRDQKPSDFTEPDHVVMGCDVACTRGHSQRFGEAERLHLPFLIYGAVHLL